MPQFEIVTVIVVFVAGVAAGAGAYFMLRGLGFFQYMGGKKSSLRTVGKEALVNALLALNDPAKPYHIVRGEDTDLVAEWKFVDASWYGIFNKSGLRGAYRMNLLLDEARHSVRCYEELGSVSWTAGASGLVPSVHYRKSFFGGRVLYKKEWGRGYGIKDPSTLKFGKVYDYKFDINDIRQPVIVAVEESGWEWVPVTARRHATYKI
jgi:hypothetical protein